MLKIYLKNLFFIALLFVSTTCGTGNSDVSPCVEPPLLLSISQDVELGKQVAAEIDGNPSTYPLLDSATNKDVYAYLYNMRNEILKSSKFQHASDFAWRLRVIKDDATLNAFCTPGGYIYIYTGIIKYLDNPDDLAGVLGHEMGHADLRHSAYTLQNNYGINFLLQILGGDSSQLVNIANQLRDLKNSRCHETQADEASVSFLNGSIYKCNGAASFFQKIVASGGSSTPEILSTHPDPGNRVENINAKAAEIGCNTTANASLVADFNAFKAKLP